MGWGSSIYPLLIVTSSGGFSGLFVYSPGPGNGNLIASVTAQAGTDPYGNAYQAGITSYNPAGGGGQRTTLNGGTITQTGAPALHSVAIGVQSVGSFPQWETFQNALGYWFDAPVASVLSRWWVPGSTPGPGGTLETWHTLTPVAGFAAGTPAPRYRFEGIGTAGQVRLDGQISLTANQAAGTAFFTMPAAYTPTRLHNAMTVSNMAGSNFNNGTYSVQTSGQLQIGGAGANGTVFFLDDFTYPLD